MDAEIVWTRCEKCNAQLYLKRRSGRRPKYCSSCLKKMQDDYRKEK